MSSPDSPVQRYHDGTKHHVNRFARSLGYLDWASQPRPFRLFEGAAASPLHPAPGAGGPPYSPPPARYDDIFTASIAPQLLTVPAVGDLLRHSLGLSAWKRFGDSRWSLRVNPSSGNLHPTEAYVVCGPLEGLSDRAGVYHYNVEEHLLERRCAFDPRAWADAAGGAQLLLVALSSIHWRESWKYGERAFRYCQHDLGHAMAAVALAAAALGWRVVMVPSCSHQDMRALTGLGRDEDFVDAEREEPGCLLAIIAGGGNALEQSLDLIGGVLVGAVRDGEWSGHASRLSEDHVEWTFIDEIASATEDLGRSALPALPAPPALPARSAPPASPALPALPILPFRALAIQRRSAVAFDGLSSLPAETWFAMLARAMPRSGPPWNTMWWTPRIHLVLFVHRVDGVDPGLYLLSREPSGGERLSAALRADLFREPAHDTLPLTCLGRGDARSLSRRLSCDQDIAADGFFSLGMIADFEASLHEYGPSFYRHLFWEAGAIGQVLYLEAEARGARATGIGCFFDDAVHETLGITGHAFQSLYHFTVGIPVEDARLTTDPGYPWST